MLGCEISGYGRDHKTWPQTIVSSLHITVLPGGDLLFSMRRLPYFAENFANRMHAKAENSLAASLHLQSFKASRQLVQGRQRQPIYAFGHAKSLEGISFHFVQASRTDGEIERGEA